MSVEYTDLTEVGEKVVVVGEASVGKTSIIERFDKDTFRQSTLPTVGCDKFDKEVQVGNDKVRLSIWDTAGQERFRGMSAIYFKKCQAVVLVFDLTRAATFDKLDYWLE